MNSLLKKCFILEVVFGVISGILLHFCYEWSGNNTLIGLFSPVNESTWEHLKLLFWPTFLLSIVEYIYIGKKYNNYPAALVISIFAGLFLIISLFYTYTGIIGTNQLWMDIAVFVISVVISRWIEYYFMIKERSGNLVVNIIAVITIILLAAMFIIFTFFPPHIPLFKDPLNGSYGI